MPAQRTRKSASVEAVRQRSTGVIGWPLASRAMMRPPGSRQVRRSRRMVCVTSVEIRAESAVRMCVGCGEPMTVRHAQCARALVSTRWTPCLECCGTRTDRVGRECGCCAGVGFIEVISIAGRACA